MTMVQSHALIAEKLAEHKPRSTGRSTTDSSACTTDDANALSDLIAHVCSRILEDRKSVV